MPALRDDHHHVNDNHDDGRLRLPSAAQDSGGDVELLADAGVYVDRLFSAHGRWFDGGWISIVVGGDVEIDHGHDEAMPAAGSVWTRVE